MQNVLLGIYKTSASKVKYHPNIILETIFIEDFLQKNNQNDLYFLLTKSFLVLLILSERQLTLSLIFYIVSRIQKNPVLGYTLKTIINDP